MNLAKLVHVVILVLVGSSGAIAETGEFAAKAVEEDFHSQGKQITGVRLAKIMSNEQTDALRIQKLRRHIKNTKFGQGGVGVRAILSTLEYNERKVEALKAITCCRLGFIACSNVVDISRDIEKGNNNLEVIPTFIDGHVLLPYDAQVEITKMLVFHTVDLNQSNIESIVNTFYLSTKRNEIRNFCEKIFSMLPKDGSSQR
jgi:hypothetical protein